MVLNKNNTLLFIGDSITDCGRAYPVGRNSKLGDGYVTLVNSLLQTFYPDLKIDILNTGISGNTILDLKARWKRDVIELKPDWVSIKIGINDVWQQVEIPNFFDQLNITSYEQIYRKLIESIIDKAGGIILMTPYYIELEKSDPMRKMMDEYGTIVQKLSAEYKTIFVNTQQYFDRYLKFNSSRTLSDDKVHPNLTGHMIIANSFLDAIGFSRK